MTRRSSARHVVGGVLLVGGAVTMAAVAVVVASVLSWSLDPDEAPVTWSDWLWAAGGSGGGAAMVALGLRVSPRSPNRAPKGGW